MVLMRKDKLENLSKVMEKFQERDGATTTVISREMDLSRQTIHKSKNFLRNVGILIEERGHREFYINDTEVHPLASRAYMKIGGGKYEGIVPCKRENFNPEVKCKAKYEIKNFLEEPNLNNFFSLMSKTKRIVQNMLTRGESQIMDGVRLLKHNVLTAYRDMMGWLSDNLGVFELFSTSPPGG